MLTRATRTRLSKLVDLGLVAELGLNDRDPKKKYSLPRVLLGGDGSVLIGGDGSRLRG